MKELYTVFQQMHNFKENTSNEKSCIQSPFGVVFLDFSMENKQINKEMDNKK